MNNIMNTLKTLSLVLALVLLSVLGAEAQTATTQTILSAAVSSGNPGSNGCITVASTTGFSASTQTQTYYAWFDGELMKVQTVNTSSGAVCGTRGYIKTRSTAHPTAAVVFFGLAGASSDGIGYPFTANSPNPGASCTATKFGYLPIINYTDGTLWNCLPVPATGTGTSQTIQYNKWIAFNFMQWSYGHPTVNVNDAAYTATLADEFVIMTRLTAARTITLPPITGVLGKTMIVKNNTENALVITVSASAGQGVGTAGANSITVCNSTQCNSGNGNVGRFVSVATSAGGWSWATW